MQLDHRIEARVEVEQMDVSLRLVPYTIATSFSVVEVIILLFWKPDLRLYLTILQLSLVVLSTISLWRCYKWRLSPNPHPSLGRNFLKSSPSLSCTDGHWDPSLGCYLLVVIHMSDC